MANNIFQGLSFSALHLIMCIILIWVGLILVYNSRIEVNDIISYDTVLSACYEGLSFSALHLTSYEIQDNNVLCIFNDTNTGKGYYRITDIKKYE